MFFMYVCKLLSFIYASGLYAQIVWLLNKQLFFLNYFMPFMSAAMQYRLYVTIQSEECLTLEHELVPKTPWKCLGNLFHQLPTGGEICLHRCHQWKSRCLFLQAQLCYKKEQWKMFAFISTLLLLDHYEISDLQTREHHMRKNCGSP